MNENKKTEIFVIDLSIKGIIFKIKELSFVVKKDDVLTLEIVYKDFTHSNSLSEEEEFIRLPLKTRVYKIKENGDVVVIVIDPNQINNLRKYVVNREMELIEEFKTIPFNH